MWRYLLVVKPAVVATDTSRKDYLLIHIGRGHDEDERYVLSFWRRSWRQASPAPSSAARLTVAQGFDPQSLWPNATTNAETYNVGTPVVESLFWLDASDNKIKPLLALSYVQETPTADRREAAPGREIHERRAHERRCGHLQLQHPDRSEADARLHALLRRLLEGDEDRRPDREDGDQIPDPADGADAQPVLRRSAEILDRGRS